MNVRLVLAGFGVFWLTEVVKAIIPWRLHAMPKLIIAMVVSTGLVILAFESEEPSTVAFGIAVAAGVGALVHKVHRFMSAAGDAQLISLAQKTRLQRRP